MSCDLLSQPQSHHFLLSDAAGRHPDDDVLPDVSLSRVPADVQRAGGGIQNLQVPGEAQRFWQEETGV